jgi:diguanylate cyclase (GGDEF)-like protein
VESAAGAPGLRHQAAFPRDRRVQLLVSTLLLTILYAAWRHQRMSHLEQRKLLGRQVAERTQELHAANVQFEHASQSDPLTGLRNRRYLANQLPVDLAYYAREQARFHASEQVMVFALVDIDHFQRINNEHGERTGDRVLQQFAQLLLRNVRAGDYVVRWSGEQFLLVFRPLPRRHVALLGERVCRAVAQHPFDSGGGRALSLTCSVGLAEFPFSSEGSEAVGWEAMVELADAALYWVKQNGRDGWAQMLRHRPRNCRCCCRRLQAEAQALVDAGRLGVTGSRNPRPAR